MRVSEEPFVHRSDDLRNAPHHLSFLSCKKRKTVPRPGLRVAAACGRRRRHGSSAAAPLAGRCEAGPGKALRQGGTRKKRSPDAGSIYGCLNLSLADIEHIYYLARWTMPFSRIHPRSALPWSQNQGFDNLHEAEIFTKRKRLSAQAESVRVQNIRPVSGASEAKPSAVGEAQKRIPLATGFVLYPLSASKPSDNTNATRAQRPFSLWSPRTVSLFEQEPKREMGLDLRSLCPLSCKMSAKKQDDAFTSSCFRFPGFEAQRSGFKSGRKKNAAGRCRTVFGAA